MGWGVQDWSGGSRFAGILIGSPRSGQRIAMRICAAVTLMATAACLHGQAGGCGDMPATKPDDINALANTGLALSHAKQYDTAAVCYRKILAFDPNIPQIQLNLGLAEFKSGRFREAIEPFQAVLKLDQKNMQARTLLGMSYYGSRMFQEAAANLEIALAADPENGQLHYYLAQSLLSCSEYQRALKEFEWLQRQDPDAAATHVLVAEALDGLNRPEEAIQELKAVVAKSPAEPNVHFAIGYIYWSQQKDDEAEREFRLELDHDPANAQAWAWLADVLIRRNDFQKAKPLLDKALSIDQGVRIAHLDLGIVFAQDKKLDRAIAAFKEAIRLDGSKTDAHFRLAHVYKEAGKPAESAAELAIVRQLREQKSESLDKVTGHPPELQPDK
jgi:tetratricopeptide (TPR) repeat protein